MDKKQLPIGVSSFRETIEENYYYVDKTMLIDEILSKKTKVVLFTRPRRFGKTLNMTMIKEFFDISLDSKELFKGLKIENSPYYNQINTAPVIFFSFRDCKGGKAYLVANMKREIYSQYEKYAFIRESLDNNKKNTMDRIVSNLIDSSYENLQDVCISLQFLTQIVNQYYKKPVILLIDEYDTPMISAYTEKCYEELRSFFSTLYSSALKDNVYLKQALLTGIQRVAKENIFSGLNNIIVSSVASTGYAKHFGLLEEETEKLLNYYDLELNDQVKSMYDGYNFGGYEMYNPWSVLNYANEKKLMPYWINTSSNMLIRECIQQGHTDFKEDFEKLIAEGTADVSLKTETSFFELKDTSTLWGLLLSSGYITLTNDKADFDRLQRTVKIPNREVKQEFRTIVAQYAKINESSLEEMFDALLYLKDIEKFKKVYKKIILNNTSFHDARENAYHMLFLGMCIYLDGYYVVKSNIEAGKGRSDIYLKAKTNEYPNLIIEFKYGEDLEKLALEAIKQIQDKQYYAD
ncbi:AAA family ATPase, partial [Chryseobacterium sp.]|uniref:AAA family ATPase n=1 Tax=Chryseobacterium sp. TaxID=1871047 RepID=UPI002FCC12C2